MYSKWVNGPARKEGTRKPRRRLICPVRILLEARTEFVSLPGYPEPGARKVLNKDDLTGYLDFKHLPVHISLYPSPRTQQVFNKMWAVLVSAKDSIQPPSNSCLPQTSECDLFGNRVLRM